MSNQEYLDKIKNIQEAILCFIENQDNQVDYFKQLIDIIKKHNIQQNRTDFILILHLIASISNNHHREPFFFDKIEQILKFLKEDIIKYNFSNSKIFNIFSDNKRILLFLIEENIMKIDSSIIFKMKSKNSNYLEFFSPEINSNFHKNQTNFFEKRKIGENDDSLCTIIRKDIVEDFVIYVNKKNLPLSIQIQPSIFETNSFLLDKNPTLIEYAAFFGSIQIFNYLKTNNVDLTPSLWIYVIHSNNAEIISILENNRIEPDNSSYSELIKETELKYGNQFDKSFDESIKCFHNNIANYIKEQKIDFTKEEEEKEENLEKNKQINNDNNNEEEEEEANDDNDKEESIKKTLEVLKSQNIFKYYNFNFIQDNFINKYTFAVLCKCDYIKFVNFLIENEDINVNQIYIFFY